MSFDLVIMIHIASAIIWIGSQFFFLYEVFFHLFLKYQMRTGMDSEGTNLLRVPYLGLLKRLTFIGHSYFTFGDRVVFLGPSFPKGVLGQNSL